MSLDLNNSLLTRLRVLPLVLIGVITAVSAEPQQDAGEMLDEGEYRGEIEEEVGS